MLHRLTALDFSNQTVSLTSSLAQEQVRYRCVTLLEMSPLSQLVQLSLKDVYLAPVNMILKRCLRLRELSILFTVMGAVTWDEDQYRGGSLLEPSSSVTIGEVSGRKVQEGRDGEGGGVCSSRFSLRSLVLQNVETSLHSLVQWLGHLPSLHTLQLQSVRLTGTDSIYTVLDTIHSQFYTHIGAACPSLQSLHISFDSVRRQQPQALAHLQASFPCLQKLSLGSTDLLLTWANMLPQLFNWLRVSSLLTSFEITPSKHGPSRGGQHIELLHVYLCSESARRLRHLRIKGIYFPSEYLTKSPPRGQLTMLPAVWTCRRLETLHIRFENVRNEEETAREARHMFGYLSRVCPELRDLWIARKLLYLGFNSGLCLLTRLQKLETLTIVSHWGHFLRLREKDLEWIGPWYADRMRLEGMEDAVRSVPGAVTARPAMTHLLRRLMDLFRRTPSSSFPVTTTSFPQLNVPLLTPTEYLTWKDLDQLGQIQDLINWNDERHQHVHSSEMKTSTKPPVAYCQCWPYMTTFEFAMATLSTRDEFKLIENLKLMRQDIRFKATLAQ
ncbi:hypothetical protein BGZ93_011228 [Podila epicladia]|nr:hypothetical protein BGZ93_011228 [Podila epicladia]